MGRVSRRPTGLCSLLWDGVPAMSPQLETQQLLLQLAQATRSPPRHRWWCILARAGAITHSRACRWTCKGHMVINKYQNTTRRGVYTVGDVCSRALLTSGTTAVRPSPSPSPLSQCCAMAQVFRPSPRSLLAERWCTDSWRASRTPSWTTVTPPPSSSATRPSAP